MKSGVIMWKDKVEIKQKEGLERVLNQYGTKKSVFACKNLSYFKEENSVRNKHDNFDSMSWSIKSGYDDNNNMKTMR